MYDPLDHLYHDPALALVQDLCGKIFWPTVSGSYRRTCARSLYQDPFEPLYRDPVGPLYQDPVGQLVQDLCFRISV